MQLKTLVQGLVIAGLATPALAQQTQRIEITGSSIKRVQAEGALPVQVIRAADIEKQGIATAEQLVSTLSSNGSGINNLATNQGGDFLNSTADRAANNGASGASLRGLGSQYTLVLLNGRRVSTHGLSGKSVDLNSVPMAAIDRIEILKDGASAIYGTDAIGGVINFILKRDFTGFSVSGLADITQQGGGDTVGASATFGLGSLDSNGFNFMASFSFDSNSRLRGSQRAFQNGYQPGRGLAPGLVAVLESAL
jgi:iron complex outermembrane recepter protein